MNERRGASRHQHEQVWELLPWYVNGTLAEDERLTVEEHLAGCADCATEVESCRATAEAVRASAVAPSPHPAQLASLLRRLDGPPARPAGWWARTPPAARWAIAAQAAALALLLAVAAVRTQQPGAAPAPFRALSDPPAAAAPAPAERQVRLVFAHETTEREMRELLLAVHGELTGGPSELGVYSVTLPAGDRAERLEVVLAYLRAHPRVRLAEPAAGAGGG
jgi:anti-sigma-K factor RskA